MAGAGGEEDTEPVHVVDRAEQRRDLPFLRAVRAGVDMAHMDRPPQRPHTSVQLGPGRGHGGLALLGGRHDQGATSEAGHLGELSKLKRSGRCATHGRRGCTCPGPGPRRRGGRHRWRPSGTAVRAVRAGGDAWRTLTAAAPVGPVVVGPLRVGRGQDAVAQATGDPGHQLATPAMERPKLASMKAKSVKMSPPKASGKRLRLWNEADRGLTRRSRPPSVSTR